jgi:hypothetical protein
MSPALAPSRLLVCVVATVLVAAPLYAQPPPEVAPEAAPADATKTDESTRRPLAIINLDKDGDPRVFQLANDLVRLLDTHPRLRAAADPSAVAALYEPADDPDTDLLARAADDRAKALSEIDNFNYVSAIQHTEDGMRELLSVTPSVAAKPYAELELVRGKARVLLNNAAGGRLAFAHAQRLDASATLDPARETPAVISELDAAIAASAQTGTIDVKEEAPADAATRPPTVWIDGAEIGVAPGQFKVPAGIHTVWVTSLERETRGEEAMIAADAVTPVQLQAVAASTRTQVHRARQALVRAAQDATARGPAMKRLADLVGVEDALLLSKSNDTIVVQTWSANDKDHPGFGALTERTKQTPAELLDIISPPPPAKEPEPLKYPIPFEQHPWIQSTSAKVTIGIGGVAIIGVGAYLLSTWLRPRHVDFNPEPETALPGSMVRQ